MTEETKGEQTENKQKTNILQEENRE